MTYLQLYHQVELAKRICDGDDISCGSCPYADMGVECCSQLWKDISRLESALEDLGETPENLKEE